MKFWVIPSDKQPRTDEMLLEEEAYLELVVEKGHDKYH